MQFGANSNTFAHAARYANIPDFWVFYERYMKIEPRLTTTAPIYARALAGEPPPRSILQCPSNPRTNFYDGAAYRFHPGSTLDLRVTPTKLAAVGRKVPQVGPNPALFSDLMYVSDVTGWPTRAASNHWNRATGEPAGGNVVSLDGSVTWFSYSLANSSSTTMQEIYVQSNAIARNIGFPSNAVFLVTDAAGNLKDGYSLSTMHAGRQWYYVRNMY
jgi:hypothetical protein